MARKECFLSRMENVSSCLGGSSGDGTRAEDQARHRVLWNSPKQTSCEGVAKESTMYHRLEDIVATLHNPSGVVPETDYMAAQRLEHRSATLRATDPGSRSIDEMSDY